jgi:hypothetical protein
MRSNSFGRTKVMLGIAASVLLLGAAVTSASAVEGQPRFELPEAPDEVVISFTERPGEVASSEPLSLRVYADGRVERHVPAHLSKAGTYVAWIEPAKVTALVEKIARDGVLEFDAAAVRDAKRQVEKKSGILHYSSDPSLIEIEVRLAGYQAAGSLRMETDVVRNVTWSGLRADVGRFKEIPAIQGLHATFVDLMSLAEMVVEQGDRNGEGGAP